MAANQIVPALKKYAQIPAVVERVQKCVENKDLFFSTLYALANDNYMLQNCTPESIFKSAIMAAEMGLSISPVMGYAYVVPYGKEAKFSVGYKGLLQLALSTSLYKRISATEVYADEINTYNPLTTEFTFKDGFNPQSERFSGGSPIGYYASFELLNGFTSSVFMTTESMEKFALQYSKAYQNDKSKGKSNSPWSTAFNKMGIKTVLRQLLTTYGPKNSSLELAITNDADATEELQIGAVQSTHVEVARQEQKPLDKTPDNIGNGMPAEEEQQVNGANY